MKKTLFVLICIVLSLLVSSCNASFFSHDGQKVTVMVVGLDYAPRQKNLEGKPISLKWSSYSVGKLEGTINDSKEIGAALSSLYKDKKVEHDMIFMLSEGDTPEYSNPLYPTATNIISQIKSLNLDKDDLFVFYYAGHGFLEDKELYFITGDDHLGGFCTALKSSDLMSAIKDVGCRSAVIIDACYSGAFDPKNSSTPNTFTTSLKNIFKEKINVETGIRVSVLAASKWNEKSLENYKVVFGDGRYEIHGHFSGRLLSALNWQHSLSSTTTVKNIDQTEIVANGYSKGIIGSLSLDDIYSKLFDERDYPDLYQYPVIYYTNESINLIPSN